MSLEICYHCSLESSKDFVSDLTLALVSSQDESIINKWMRRLAHTIVISWSRLTLMGPVQKAIGKQKLYYLRTLSIRANVRGT